MKVEPRLYDQLSYNKVNMWQFDAPFTADELWNVDMIYPTNYVLCIVLYHVEQVPTKLNI